MNKIITIALLLFVNITSFSQGKTEETERIRIANNKVKKSVQWLYKYTQGKVNAKGYISTENKYDEKGNAIEIISYKATGKISSKLTYKYDKNNNRIEYLKYSKTDKEELGLTYKQVFSYDEVGNKKVEIGFDGITGYTIVYSYLPEYKQKSIIKYNSDKSIAEKWEYSYNDRTQTINIFKSGNILDYTIQRKTDANGNIIEEIRKDSKGKEVNRTTSEYDSKNNLLSTSEYFSGKLSKKLTYKYNSSNLPIEITQTNPDGSKILYRSYKYDGKGNILEEKWYDGVPNDYSSKTYKYDDKFNVVEVESYYSDYKYKALYKYTYEFF